MHPTPPDSCTPLPFLSSASSRTCRRARTTTKFVDDVALKVFAPTSFPHHACVARLGMFLAETGHAQISDKHAHASFFVGPGSVRAKRQLMSERQAFSGETLHSSLLGTPHRRWRHSRS